MLKFLDTLETYYNDVLAANRKLTLARMAREGNDIGTVIHKYEDLTLDEVEELARHHFDPTGHQTDLPVNVITSEMQYKIDDITDLRPDIGQRLSRELALRQARQE